MFVTLYIPDGVKLDGAVVELYVRDSQVAAEVRIPAPED